MWIRDRESMRPAHDTFGFTNCFGDRLVNRGCAKPNENGRERDPLAAEESHYLVDGRSARGASWLDATQGRGSRAKWARDARQRHARALV